MYVRGAQQVSVLGGTHPALILGGHLREMMSSSSEDIG